MSRLNLSLPAVAIAANLKLLSGRKVLKELTDEEHNALFSLPPEKKRDILVALSDDRELFRSLATYFFETKETVKSSNEGGEYEDEVYLVNSENKKKQIDFLKEFFFEAIEKNQATAVARLIAGDGGYYMPSLVGQFREDCFAKLTESSDQSVREQLVRKAIANLFDSQNSVHKVELLETELTAIRQQIASLPAEKQAVINGIVDEHKAKFLDDLKGSIADAHERVVSLTASLKEKKEGTRDHVKYEGYLEDAKKRKTALETVLADKFFPADKATFVSAEEKESIRAFKAACEANNGLFGKMLVAIEQTKTKLNDLIPKHDDWFGDSRLGEFASAVKTKLKELAEEIKKDPAKTGASVAKYYGFEACGRAYDEAKSDLGYCKDKDSKKQKAAEDALLFKKAEVLGTERVVQLAEADQKAGRGNGPTQVEKLEALKAKLEYQELLYAARKNSKHEHYGFFNSLPGITGYSASDKHVEAKAMVAEVKRLIANLEKPLEQQEASTWEAKKAASGDKTVGTSALTKLYNELVLLGGDDLAKRASSPQVSLQGGS